MPITGTVVRGSIVWMNLYPQSGHEQAGYRPAIVISDGLIDPSISELAFIVPVTNQAKGYSFEVPVPAGIPVNGALLGKTDYTHLSGVVLTDHAKSLDLSTRGATVFGQIDPTSHFYTQVISYVRSILA
jgi:mRNA interferase MazF